METIVLYYRNKSDKDKEYTFKDIADGFYKSQFYADYQAGENYASTQRALVAYITEKDGLNSSFDDTRLMDLLGYVIKNKPKRGDTIRNENIDIRILADHFGNTYEAMRQLKRKWESDKTGLWIVYVKAYNWDMEVKNG